MSELDDAKAIIATMLDDNVEDAETFRRQFAAATLTRHETGVGISVDRSVVEAAPFAMRTPGDVLAEATGHGKLWLMLHVYEGFLDDLELLNGRRMPDPATVRVRRR